MDSSIDPGHALRKLTGGDKVAFLRLGNLFVSTTEESLENLSQSRAGGDCSLSMKILHRLKPNVLMFGMKDIHAEILAMEDLWTDRKNADSEFVSRCVRLEESLRSQLSDFKEYLSSIEPDETIS